MSGGDAADRAAAFLRSLEAMEPLATVTYAGVEEARRGPDGEPLPMTSAPTVVLDGLLPMTTSVRVATDNFRRPGIVVLRGRTGRYIAPFSDRPEEGETVYLPASILLTRWTRDIEGLVVTMVEEILLDVKPFPADESAVEQDVTELSMRIREERAKPQLDIPARQKWVFSA